MRKTRPSRNKYTPMHNARPQDRNATLQALVESLPEPERLILLEMGARLKGSAYGLGEAGAIELLYQLALFLRSRNLNAADLRRRINGKEA